MDKDVFTFSISERRPASLTDDVETDARKRGADVRKNLLEEIADGDGIGRVREISYEEDVFAFLKRKLLVFRIVNIGNREDFRSRSGLADDFRLVLAHCDGAVCMQRKPLLLEDVFFCFAIVLWITSECRSSAEPHTVKVNSVENDARLRRQSPYMLDESRRHGSATQNHCVVSSSLLLQMVFHGIIRRRKKLYPAPQCTQNVQQTVHTQ